MPVKVGAGFRAFRNENLARFPVARIEADADNKRADRFTYLMAASGKVSHFLPAFSLSFFDIFVTFWYIKRREKYHARFQPIT